MLNYPFRRSCKEVAALVLAREDRHLKIGEKVALRTHMIVCQACPDFERQILTMRHAMRQWRNYSADSEVSAVPSVQPKDDSVRK